MFAHRKALFVVSHWPSPEAEQAGHKTAFRFLSELAETHEVNLVALIKADEERAAEGMLRHLRPKVKSVVIVPVSAMERTLGCVYGLFLGLAPRFCTRLSLRAMKEIKKVLNAAIYDLIWVEFSQSFWTTKLVGQKPEILLSVHDIQTQLVASKSAFERLFTLGITFQSERALFAKANRIRVQSVNDKWLLHTLFRLPLQKIEVKGPSLSSFLTGVKRSAATIEPHSLLFWGAMGRPENSHAIVGFIKTNFVRLKQKYADAKIYVVGSNPPNDLRAMASADVVVTGFVNDPTPYFERAEIGIAPLISGAGIKVKVLEMLSAGLPVVSTPVGAEGIGDDSLLTITEVDSFGEAIDRIWSVRR